MQISLVMGVTGGIRPTTRATSPSCPTRCPGGLPRRCQSANWQVIGVSRDAVEAAGHVARPSAGNVRAGLEDNLYLPDGEMARSNGDLIAKARQMAEDVGRRAATVAGGARDARRPEARGDRGMTGA